MLDSMTSQRVALVTGGSRGIGRAIVRRLAADGYQVVVNFAGNQQEADAAVAEAGAENAIAVQADVADEAAVARMVADAEARFGDPVEILVNNASSPTLPKALLEQSWSDVLAHLDVQVKGALHCLKAVGPGMVARGRGHIVNIGSTHAWGVPPANLSGYVAAKSALAALTRCAAVELGPSGVHVNMISPGMTETELIADVPERMRKVFAMQTPMRRLALPDDVAAAVVMLVSKAGGFMQGADIPVCGGGVM